MQADDPVVLWIHGRAIGVLRCMVVGTLGNMMITSTCNAPTGGPGCSSALAVFYGTVIGGVQLAR